MSLWARIFAAGYDRFMAAAEEAGLHEKRRALLATATGRVVEIGAGTGANVGLYPAGAEVTYTEPEPPMAKRLRARVGDDAAVVEAPAQALPFPDATFDTAVCALVLCTVPEQAAALREIRRVLKPGGRLLFLEHVRSGDAKLAKWQDRLTPVQRRIGHGCHPNRATRDAIAAAGFAVTRCEDDRIPKAPKYIRPLILGEATAPERRAA